MKAFTSLLFFFVFWPFCFAQTTNCDNLYFDLEKGSLNGYGPDISQKKIMEKLPCFTGNAEDGSDFTCGGGVFYHDHGFFFYTGWDYIEVREGFKGKISHDLLGKSRKDVETIYGVPDRIEEDKSVYFYKTDYGSVRFVFKWDTIAEIAVYNVKPQKAKLCL